VELGLPEDLDQLSAPEEPEPAQTAVTPQIITIADAIELAAGQMPVPPKTEGARIDAGLRPASFIDSGATLALDNRCHEYMPLCNDAGKCDETSLKAGMERMPRCEELTPVVQKQPVLKAP
jgi:hypothetical protein